MSNILLVEDSPTQAMQLKILLESKGHSVSSCDDGIPALQFLDDGSYELVITDLELPVMNGLQLIKQMKANYPQVPAVLITGQGSERLAAEALRVGAASYVPKSMVEEMLLGTVDDVLGVMSKDLAYSGLIDCTVENRLIWELPNDPNLLNAAVDLVMHLAAGMGLLSGTESYRVAQALQHACSNALLRGNLELTRDQFQQPSVADTSSESLSDIVKQRMQSSPYKHRKIHFDARLMRDLMRVVIKDEGNGFDVKSLDSQHHEQDNPAAFNGGAGRGFALIHRFMDKVTFNASGNEITLVKHRTVGH